jgi:hypothetical protein
MKREREREPNRHKMESWNFWKKSRKMMTAIIGCVTSFQ